MNYFVFEICYSIDTRNGDGYRNSLEEGNTGEMAPTVLSTYMHAHKRYIVPYDVHRIAQETRRKEAETDKERQNNTVSGYGGRRQLNLEWGWGWGWGAMETNEWRTAQWQDQRLTDVGGIN